MEWLEDRDLFSGSPLDAAVPLQFLGFNTARVSDFLSSPAEVDLYRATLQPGESINARVVAQGSGLASLLRIFDSQGEPLALDDREGGDPILSFQAMTGGDYFLGVSSAPNNGYDPTLPASGIAGLTLGTYRLDVERHPPSTLMPDLVGSSFLLGTDIAAAGDAVPLHFIVDNRGGAAPGNFQVQVLLASNTRFDGAAQVLATLARTDLTPDATGRSFSSPAGFTVALPPGLSSGSAFLGLRILSDVGVPESDVANNSGVHRGSDWTPLTIVTRVPAGVSDLSAVDAGLRTGTADRALGVAQSHSYTFTVTGALGDGQLTADVRVTGGGLLPRLTLSGPGGAVLIQSDSGRLVQHLAPGTYSLTVSSRAGAGTYRLGTAFVASSAPFAPLPTGAGTFSVTTADVNNDGLLDVITANRIDNTVSVLLGNGDGTFAPARDFAVGVRPFRVTSADVNGDGRPDILTGNKGDNTASVLLGNGDGTFQNQIVVPAGTRINGALAVDVNGDGIPDLLQDNYADDTIWVLLGQGDGTFGSPTIYPTDDEGRFGGPSETEVADVNGDGFPDLIYPNYVSSNVGVRLGRGDGTFGPQRLFAAGAGSDEAEVVDVNGDGKHDLVVFNSVGNTVSVLLGNGDGTFQPARDFAVGANPYSGSVADVNGDGRPDIIAANRDDNTVSVLLGNGDGTFQTQRVYLTGRTPPKVAVGDFNGDGKPDLVTANQGDNTATVLFGNGDGTFVSGPQQAAAAPALRPFQVAVADLNGDGRPDLVTANRSDNSAGVLLANPDGSFQTRETFAVDPSPFGVAAADVNGDGVPDLVTANYSGASVTVLLGNGDGTFGRRVDLPAGSSAYNVRVADVNGDGRPDLLVANKNDNNVGVFLGHGDGTFEPMAVYPVASGPFRIATADVNGDGILDLAVSHFSATVIDILLGKGDGTFQPTRQFSAGSRPYGVAIADINGDGRPDVVTANYRSSNVTVLLGNGDGTFQAPRLVPVGRAPNEVQVADFNGDGKPDLVTANYGSNTVSILLGNGDGTFGPMQTFPAGSGPGSVAVADLDGDGVPDLVVSNRNASSVQVLWGNRDGTFQPPVPFGVGKNRYSAAVADVNGDGYPDLLTARLLQNDVTVQLGNGTGTFEPAQAIPVGTAPTSVTLRDLNGDGRLDLVVTSSDGNAVSVLLGNGDGTFSVQRSFATGRSPRAAIVADVNGDGIPDLAMANYQDNTVSVLLGRGDGTFQAQRTFAVEAKPYALTVADVNGDGKPDLITANSAGDSASVLLGNGDGSFQPQAVIATGRQPFAVAVADIDGDGKPDLVTANAFDNTVSVLRGRGDGSFATQQVFAVGSRPYSLAVADVNGDGKADLVTANYRDHSATVLLGNGDGTFQAQQTVTTDQLPVMTVVADVNTDGRPDLVTVGNQHRTAAVLVGRGDGSFQPITALTGVELRSTPFLADLDGDGIADRIVLDRSGNILFRKGLGGSTNTFAPPVVLNPGRPARDLALLHVGSGLAVAAADARFDPALSVHQFVFTVSLYTVGRDGAVSRRTAFASTALPARIEAVDLTGDGIEDLVTANALDDSVTIVRQLPGGQFAVPITTAVGSAPSDITVADVNGDGRPDVIVSNQASGDVTVVLNDLTHSFTQTLRFGAAIEASSPVSLVAGRFSDSGRTDLVVVNAAAHTFSVLQGDGGGFGDPSLPRTTSTSDGFRVNARPGAVVAGDFNRDGKLDLAILMEDTGLLWIYTGTGGGAFRHSFSIPVGDQATGLAIVPGKSTGRLDLLVGNGFGDVLHLEGKGDGSFQITGKRVSLSVIPDLFGAGQAGVLVANQQNNRVTVQTQTGGGSQFSAVQTLDTDNPSEQMAPGDVQWSLLSRDRTFPDAVVVSTGSNAVVVYRTVAITGGVPTFAPNPRTYFVGTAPAGVTVADVNGDGVPDLLVANPGSNDVSVIFGSYEADGAWTGAPGPRLRSGGAGPIGVTVRDMNSDGLPDLVVTNGGSGTLTVLPGVGQGFFDDRQPQTLFNLHSALVQAPTFVGSAGTGYGVTAGGDLVRFDLANPGAGARVVFAGQGALAARALDTGDVVVAVAGGKVKVLAPDGDGLRVAAELEAQSGVAALTSTLEVLRTQSGQLQVLVSSQGSDTIFVYAPPVAAPRPGTTQPAPTVPPLPVFIPPTAAVPTTSLAATTAAPVTAFTQIQLLFTLPGTGLAAVLASTGAAGGAGAAGSSSTTSLSGPPSLSTGLSFNGFSGHDDTPLTGTNEAMLVSVQGNAYATVAVLDFGSQQEEGSTSKRMPSLSLRHPLGDTSPLTRFVTGHEEAVERYRGAEESRLSGGDDPAFADPWSEDLFHLLRPTRRPLLQTEGERPTEQEEGSQQNGKKEEEPREGVRSVAVLALAALPFFTAALLSLYPSARLLRSVGWPAPCVLHRSETD